MMCQKTLRQLRGRPESARSRTTTKKLITRSSSISKCQISSVGYVIEKGIRAMVT